MWCLVFQGKTHPASLYVSMPVRLLGSSSLAVSTPRGIIFGQSGTPDCRTPSLVRLFVRGSCLSYVYLSMKSKKQLSVLSSLICVPFVSESCEPPTPHYNSSILGDLLPRAHVQFLSAVSSQCSAFADGVALLKVWLRQRELNQVGAQSTL